MDKIIWDAVSQVIWILVAIVVLTILAFTLPFILRKSFSKKTNICVCGEKINSTNQFCQKCGKKVGK